jgi:hypothetical protein
LPRALGVPSPPDSLHVMNQLMIQVLVSICEVFFP